MTEISIIIPMKNEAENVVQLLDEIVEAGQTLATYEIIIIDDGSQDDTADIVKQKSAELANLRLLRHISSGGQSAAVHSGVQAAKGQYIVTLDGDGQNPPAEIPKLVAPFFDDRADERLGLVAGQRVGRQDTTSKRLASLLANKLRSAVLKDATRDTGCGLKAFRRDVFLALPYFNHMHRYLPALFSRDGWAVAHVDVAHRARLAGQSNYSNLQRALVGLSDLRGVAWLIRRRKQASATEETLSHKGNTDAID